MKFLSSINTALISGGDFNYHFSQKLSDEKDPCCVVVPDYDEGTHVFILTDIDKKLGGYFFFAPDVLLNFANVIDKNNVYHCDLVASVAPITCQISA